VKRRESTNVDKFAEECKSDGYGIIPPPQRPPGLSDDDWHDGPPPAGFPTWDAWNDYRETTPGVVTSQSFGQIIAEVWPQLDDKQRAELAQIARKMARGRGRPRDRRAYALACMYKTIPGYTWPKIARKVNDTINSETPGCNCNYSARDLQRIYSRNTPRSA